MLGDFNIPCVPWFLDDDLQCYFPTNITGDIADCFLNGMMDIGLFQLSNIKNKCDNVLDYVYFSEPNSLIVTRANSTMTAVAESSNLEERFHYPLEWDIEVLNRKTTTNKSNEKIK